jgi:hypothetical protein
MSFKKIDYAVDVENYISEREVEQELLFVEKSKEEENKELQAALGFVKEFFSNGDFFNSKFVEAFSDKSDFFFEFAKRISKPTIFWINNESIEEIDESKIPGSNYLSSYSFVRSSVPEKEITTLDNVLKIAAKHLLDSGITPDFNASDICNKVENMVECAKDYPYSSQNGESGDYWPVENDGVYIKRCSNEHIFYRKVVKDEKNESIEEKLMIHILDLNKFPKLTVRIAMVGLEGLGLVLAVRPNNLTEE